MAAFFFTNHSKLDLVLSLVFTNFVPMKFTSRQIEIIEAATKLIGEKGIQNLTTKNLAAEIGFSEPALYRHFKDKTEIIECILTFYMELLDLGLKSIIHTELNGIEKVKKMFDFQFDHFATHPAVIMVIFAETSFQYNSILSKAVGSIMTQKRTMVGQIITSGQLDGSIRNDIGADQLTTMIMGSMRFTLLRWRLSEFQFNLIDEGKDLWNTIDLLIKRV